MRRKTIGVIVTITLSILAAPIAASAQPQANVPRIGWLSFGYSPSEADRQRSLFLQGLRELGWVEGQNIVIEQRYAEEHSDRLPALAAELVQLRVKVLVLASSAAIPAAKQATSTIPIVMTVSDDPVGRGFVASLARPGGNITGLTDISPQLVGKRLELLKEVVPSMVRLAVLGPPNHADWPEVTVTAQALGIHLQALTVQRPDDFELAFEAATRERLMPSSCSFPHHHSVSRTYCKPCGPEPTASNISSEGVCEGWGPHGLWAKHSRSAPAYRLLRG